MPLGGNDNRFKRGRKVILILDQGRRDRTRYRVVRCVNSVAWQMGRKLTREDVRRIIASGVEVTVQLRKDGGN